MCPIPDGDNIAAPFFYSINTIKGFIMAPIHFTTLWRVFPAWLSLRLKEHPQDTWLKLWAAQRLMNFFSAQSCCALQLQHTAILPHWAINLNESSPPARDRKSVFSFQLLFTFQVFNSRQKRVWQKTGKVHQHGHAGSLEVKHITALQQTTATGPMMNNGGRSCSEHFGVP